VTPVISAWIADMAMILAICAAIIGAPVGIWRFVKSSVREAQTEHTRQLDALWAKVDGLVKIQGDHELTLVREYATLAALKESEARSERLFREAERRMTEHLIRIETKLDGRAPAPRAE
jgi:hypothetical protein